MDILFILKILDMYSEDMWFSS